MEYEPEFHPVISPYIIEMMICDCCCAPGEMLKCFDIAFTLPLMASKCLFFNAFLFGEVDKMTF